LRHFLLLAGGKLYPSAQSNKIEWATRLLAPSPIVITQPGFIFEFGQNQTGYILIQTTARLESEIFQKDELSAGQWRCALPREA
jgi:hypothetical protein